MLELNKIYLGDCLEVMKGIEDKSVDLVLTDPPYNASNYVFDTYRKGTTINEGWDKNFNISLYARNFERILKDNGSLLLFTSHHSIEKCLFCFKRELKLKQMLHWRKTNPRPICSMIYTPSIEYIIWFSKGKNYWGSTKDKNPHLKYIFNIDQFYTDTFDYPICGGKERTSHPTQKPLKLIKELVKIHSNEGSLILDPFSGSGTTAIAAKELKRNFIAIEKDEKYHELSIKRMKEHFRQQEIL